jgi:hydrogenase maturation protein HypF
MAPDFEWVQRNCCVGNLEELALTGPESPIVLLARRAAGTNDIAENIAPRNPNLGVMLPYTPLHHLLVKFMGGPVVATSGNRKEEPICIDEREALSRLRGLADVFLIHDRPIRRHADDSIVRVIMGRVQVLRRARGYAPLPVSIPAASAGMLGAGAHLKNAVALSVPAENGLNVFISQYIGDLSTRESYLAYRSVIEDFERLFNLRNGSIACDAHPDYLSSQFARSRESDNGANVVSVQHHCAHVASCMADNCLDPPVLGVAFDGSGYGTDGTLWGGEFIFADMDGFRRVGHMRTFSLPGGESAIRKPGTIALGILFEILGDRAFDREAPQVLLHMLQRRINSPRTSSVGRLFDAVASMCGILQEANFEGQAAMELEFAVKQGIQDSYSFTLRETDPLIVDWEPMILQIRKETASAFAVGAVNDRAPSIAIGEIAAKFHNTIAEMIVAVAHRIGESRVALTGGCFQNRYLTEQTVERLRRAGFQPYWHQRVPPNDGGISLGQVFLSACYSKYEEKPCVLQFRAG